MARQLLRANTYCDWLIPISFVTWLKWIQMNTTAELSWIFPNLPVFPLVCAGCGYLFPGGDCAFILPSWCNVYWNGCHPKGFERAVFQPEPLGSGKGGARACRNHNCFHPLVKCQLLDHPLQPRACVSIPCAHIGVRACLQICVSCHFQASVSVETSLHFEKGAGLRLS